MRRLLLLVPMFLFAACSGHALDGHWNQVTADGKPGITIEFDTKSSECGLHGAPREDGGHRHASGTYTYDAATQALTVKMKLLEDGPEQWTGKLVDGKLELSSAGAKLEFKKGAAAH